MKRAGWWTLFVLLVMILAFDALLVIVAVVETAQGDLKGGVGAAIAVIVLFLVVGVGLVALARVVEHRVRLNHHPVGGRWGVPAGIDWRPAGARPAASPSAMATGTATDPGPETIGGAVVPEWHPSPTVRRYPRRSARLRRHSPLGKAISLLVLVGFAIGFPVATIISFANWRTSVSIQDHGIPSTLTVAQVIEVDHSSRSGNYDTVNLQGILSSPVKGQLQTTVYTPHDNFFFDGEQVSVLVDPSDPSHAELPGQPQHSETSFVIILVFTVVIYLFAGSVVVLGLRTRRRRRLKA